MNKFTICRRIHRRISYGVPIWITMSVLSLILLGIFGWYQFQLNKKSDKLVEEISTIGKLASPAPLQGALTLAQLLQNEINQGKVRVDENNIRKKVIFSGDAMFVVGKAEVNYKSLPLLKRVAAELSTMPGQIQVIGYTDNRPVKTPQFPNNLVLSEKRAASVSAVLQAAGVAKSRLTVIGRGDANPVANNVTTDGRAKNRRVEIIVTQSALQPESNAEFKAESQKAESQAIFWSVFMSSPKKNQRVERRNSNFFLRGERPSVSSFPRRREPRVRYFAKAEQPSSI